MRPEVRGIHNPPQSRKIHLYDSIFVARTRWLRLRLRLERHSQLCAREIKQMARLKNVCARARERPEAAAIGESSRNKIIRNRFI